MDCLTHKTILPPPIPLNSAGNGRVVTLVDTTLRDGAQAAGICLGLRERIRIARAVADIGIGELELGVPAMGADERRAIRAIAREIPHARRSAWCRAREEDLDAALRCGCDTAHVSFPLSAVHLSALRKDEPWLFRQARRLCNLARRRFPRFTVGCQDATRAPIDRVIAFAQLACSLGAARIRIADTVGIMNPMQTFNLVSILRVAIPAARFEFHAHNDLGMATGNTVAAIEAGAEAASVTVTGVGERAGNASLEEVVMALRASYPSALPHVRTGRMRRACALVADLTGRPLSPWKPVVGSDVFVHESGIHCHGLSVDPRTYEPFDPAQTGAEPSRMVAGTHSGSAGIQSMLRAEGLDISRSAAKAVGIEIRKLSLKRRRAFTEKELLRIASGILSQPKIR
jgi:homocitrate synthase NifV